MSPLGFLLDPRPEREIDMNPGGMFFHSRQCARSGHWCQAFFRVGTNKFQQACDLLFRTPQVSFLWING